MTSVDRDPFEPVLAFIRQSCSRPENRFGPEFVEEHLLVVERYALALADTLAANRTVVRFAALLHDIAAIEDATRIPVHAERGAEQVARLCGASGPFAGVASLDGAEIERIATCVREHSTPRHPGETIAESVAVSNADAMSQIARPFYWFHYARAFKRLSHGDAIAWYRTQVEHNWSALIGAARAHIDREHEAVRKLLAAPPLP